MSYKTRTLAIASLLQYFTAEETSGTTLADSKGTDDGAVTGTSFVVGQTPGLPTDTSGGLGLLLGGDGVVTSAGTVQPLANAAWTIDVWHIPAGGGGPNALVSIGTPGGTSYQGVGFSVAASSTIYVKISGLSDRAITVSDFSTGPHYLAFSYDGTSILTYLDGVLVDSYVLGVALDLQPGGIRLGTSPFDNAEPGTSFHAALFSDVLSASIISGRFVAGMTDIFPPTGLTATANPIFFTNDLAWTAPGGGATPDSYSVWRGTSSGAETLLASGVLIPSYQDVSITAGAHYWYYIISHVTGLDSDPSSEANVVSPAMFVQRERHFRHTIIPPSSGVSLAGKKARADLIIPSEVTVYVDLGGGSHGPLIEAVPVIVDIDAFNSYDLFLVAPQDMVTDPPGVSIGYKLTEDAIVHTMTDWAYSSSITDPSTLYDASPLSAIEVEMHFYIIDSSGAPVVGETVSYSIDTDSDIVGFSSYRLLASNVVTTDRSGTDGKVLLRMVPTSLLDVNRFYRVKPRNGNTLYRIVPTAADIVGDATLANLNDTRNAAAVTVSGDYVAHEIDLLSNTLTATHHASPVTLVDDLENLVEADTHNLKVQSDGGIIVKKHAGIVGSPPNITAGAAMGTAPNITAPDATHVATDVHGHIYFTTGTSPAAGKLCTVTFNDADSVNVHSPTYFVQSGDTATDSALQRLHVEENVSGASFDIYCSGTPSASTAYHVKYHGYGR